MRYAIELRAGGVLSSPEAAAQRRVLLESQTKRRILSAATATAPAAAPSARRSKSLGSARQSRAARERLGAAELAGAARLAARTPGGKLDSHRNRARWGPVAPAFVRVVPHALHLGLRHLVRHVGHRAGHPQWAPPPPGACAHFKRGQNKAAEQLFPIFPSGTTQRPRRLSMRRLNDERELELLVRMRYLSPKSQGPDKSGLLFSPATVPTLNPKVQKQKQRPKAKASLGRGERAP